MINITFSMILCMWFTYHIPCRFPAAQIRKDAEPEDWAAITVVLQFYGCRNECGVLRAFGIFWEVWRNVRVNARKRPRRWHTGISGFLALTAQLLQDKVLNFSGQTVE